MNIMTIKNNYTLRDLIKEMSIDGFKEYIGLTKNKINEDKINYLSNYFNISQDEIFNILNTVMDEEKKLISIYNKLQSLPFENIEFLSEYINFLADNSVKDIDKETSKVFTKKFIKIVKEDN